MSHIWLKYPIKLWFTKDGQQKLQNPVLSPKIINELRIFHVCYDIDFMDQASYSLKDIGYIQHDNLVLKINLTLKMNLIFKSNTSCAKLILPFWCLLWIKPILNNCDFDETKQPEFWKILIELLYNVNP